MTMPTEALLERWQRSNDLDALDELLRFEVALLRERIRKRRGYVTGPSASASDIAQEAALGLLRARTRPSFSGGAALRAYLLRSAKRLLARRLRRQDEQRRAAGSDVLDAAQVRAPIPTGDSRGAQIAEEMRLALELLRPEDREILTLVYVQRMTSEEAGDALRLSAPAARKRLERARRALAERLGSWSRVVTGE